MNVNDVQTYFFCLCSHGSAALLPYKLALLCSAQDFKGALSIYHDLVF